MTPKCTRLINARGLCWTCYGAFRRSVNRGEISESEAIDRGLILPKGKRGPKGNKWVKAAFPKQKGRHAND